MGASEHFDFPSDPVDLWVMFLQPRVSEDVFFLPQACDGEQCSLQVPFVPQNEINHFSDGASLIQSTVNVMDWDQSGELPGLKSTTFDVLLVDELSSGPRVNEGT